MTETSFGVNKLCGICAVSELPSSDRETISPLIVALATGGMTVAQVEEELSDTPTQKTAAVSCGRAIRDKLCLRYLDLNPEGGYDG